LLGGDELRGVGLIEVTEYRQQSRSDSPVIIPAEALNPMGVLRKIGVMGRIERV